MHTCGSSRGDYCSMKSSLGDHINLDGRVTARVVDLASVDLADRHIDWSGRQ